MGNPNVLFPTTDMPLSGQEALVPLILIQKATATTAGGLLFYGYTPNYGTEAPASQHYLVSCPITFNVSENEARDSAKSLAKTRRHEMVRSQQIVL